MTSLDDYREATLNLGTSDARVIGKHFEYDYALNRQTKRYYAEGKLLATRMSQLGCPPTGTCEELTYIQGDHLGSTSTLTGTDRKVVAKERYSAFGERRRGETTLVTDQLYTGQRLNVLSGLYHYSDGSSAGRFCQAVADIPWRPAHSKRTFACCQRLVSLADYADAPL